jgi:N-acetylmuramoyl-L-alanine amidase CwlA|nr:MAG TPA: N-acetylmuramoyl-L-alanine amidase [Caudoviricetes sp.]
MATLRQLLVSESKYDIKCPYTMVAEGYCVHNTANDAPAENEANYMRNNDKKVSFHYVIDDKEVIQCIPENRNAFHAGDGVGGNGNRKHIAVEICYSKSGGEKFTKAEKNAAEFIAKGLKEKGWGIDKVRKHQDFSGKYCPHRTLDLGWERFLNLIRSYMGQATVPTPPSKSTTPPQKKEKLTVDGRWGVNTTKETQRFLKTIVDGIVSRQPASNRKYLKNAFTDSWQFTSNYKGGSAMIKALQRLIGAKVDGFFGKNSVIALQNFLIRNGYSVGKYGADGVMGYDTVCAWQRYLNAH